MHKRGAVWRQSVPVHEMFRGKTLWRGEVEAFDLNGQPKAERCYAWTHGEPEKFSTILGLLPVDFARSAVKVGVAYQINKARAKGAK